MSKRNDTDPSLPRWGDATDLPKPTRKDPMLSGRPKRLMDDDRPTELFEPAQMSSLATSREQIIVGSTISEMIRNAAHKLSRPLAQLVAQAKADLPSAVVDARASLVLHHDFEFDRRVGYRLQLKLLDAQDRCVEVSAEVDHDGRKIRQGSMVSKLIQI